MREDNRPGGPHSQTATRRETAARRLSIQLLLLALLLAPGLRAQTAAPRTGAQTSTDAQANAGARTQTPAPAQTAARVVAVPFESRLVGQPLPYNVVLPIGYDAPSARATRYPVLYLLHGLGGSAEDWVSNRAHLADYAARYPLIIVVPEGKAGWYTDAATAPNDKFETYFVRELLPDVQRRFRTLEAREGRAVAGLSMGGYGSLKFGLKYPELFAFAASMSGALGAPSWKPEDRLPEFVKPSVARVYGPADSPVRPANDIFKIVRDLPAERVAALPYFYLDCGTEDFLIESNRDFAGLLLAKKIPHEYRQLPGTHSWPYWDRQVQEVLKLASQRLAPPTAPPPKARLTTPEHLTARRTGR